MGGFRDILALQGVWLSGMSSGILVVLRPFMPILPPTHSAFSPFRVGVVQ